ncbi:MAG: GntR family transcriptional regulator [Alkalibacterium sp.]|nr:GntR family transcriptional regulator [Alkalibacterium sp.]
MDSSIPIYLQISQFIENEVISNRLTAEDKVPSTNEFSKKLNVNPATAGKGLNALVDQGILYKKRGLGMFVTPEAKSIIIDKRRKQFEDKLLPDFLYEAKQLKISKEELIQWIGSDYDD